MEPVERDIKNTRWTPIEMTGYRDGQPVWLMICKCGTQREVLYKNYLRGLSLSCGCYRKETARGSNRLPPGESARNQLMLIYKRSAQKAGREFALTKDEFLGLTSANCFYCGQPPHQVLNRAKYTGKGNGSYIYNGIDRIDSSKGYTVDNCVTACRMCNYAKSDMPYIEFIQWLDRLAVFRTEKMQCLIS